MSIEQIRPHLYRLVLGRYQAYLWSDEDSTTLVDTGEVGSGGLIRDALGAIGLGLQDVDRIVLTHFHDDHAGSAAELVPATKAEVFAHADDAPFIECARPRPLPNLTDFERELHAQVADGLQPAPPVQVNQRLHDGSILDFAGGAYVISTPGHTDGSIALYLPEHGICLTGDIAAEHQGQVMLGPFNLDTARAARSLHRVAALDIETACFGHGDPVVVDAAERLRQAAESASS